ncbi:ribosome recycling factor [Deltaproteobacteria bacterium PRO3]|nr:ribosome recycling factor [Deltaproteobacteria bacterium PRO3]
MSHPVLNKSKDRMEKCLAAFRGELAKVRTGRASTSMLDDIRVDYYGTPTPLNQVGTLSVPEPRMITISPWDATAIPLIEKAIIKSDLGLTPANDGKLIRIPIPALNEERRKEMVKLARKYGEEAKVAIRHVRREALDELKALEKDKKMPEDEAKHLGTEVQKLTDSYVKKVDESLEHKEKEVMEV